MNHLLLYVYRKMLMRSQVELIFHLSDRRQHTLDEVKDAGYQGSECLIVAV